MKSPHEELIMRVFDKAKSKSGSDTKNGQATHLAATFSDDFHHSISVKTLTTIYNIYILKDTSRSATLKPELLTVMARYIGYDNYEEFVNETNIVTPPKKIRVNKLERITLISLVILLFIGLSYTLVFSSETEKCMSWTKVNYEIVSCDISEAETPNQIIIYNKALYKKQRKISPADVKIGESYYCKMNDDSIEYFSYYGQHPITKKHLKPVTEYIYKKYVTPLLEK